MVKYTIEGFSQAYAMTLRKTAQVGDKSVTRKIDCTDLVILRWFVDFYPNMKKIEVDGKQYAWLTHKKLIEDLPLIDITRKSFVERMQKLVDFEILTYRLLKEGGTFSLYGFGEKYENLVGGVSVQTDTGCTVDRTRGIHSNGHGVSVQTDNKDTSIKDTSITHTSIKGKKERKKGVSFDTLIEQYSNGDDEIKEWLGEWLKVRKAKRAAMTDKAIELNLQKVYDYARQSNMTVVAYLQEVVRKGWVAFYPIEKYSNPKQERSIMDDYNDMNEIIEGGLFK